MVSVLKDLYIGWFRAIRTCYFGKDTVGQSLSWNLLQVNLWLA